MEQTLNYSQLTAAARRQWKPFFLCVAAGLGLAFIYVFMSTPQYTAIATVLIDKKRTQEIRGTAHYEDPADFASQVESQAEVLRSDQLALEVVQRLKLDKEIEANMGFSPIGALRRIFQADEDPSVKALKRQLAAAQALQRKLRVTRVAKTFVLQVEYTSPNPVRAAQIANAVVTQYIDMQLKSRVEIARMTRDWLKSQTEKLRRLSVDADLQAQEFKANNKLLSAKGTLISDQEYNETTSQVVQQRAATEQARARYSALKQAIEERRTDSAVTDALNSQVVVTLRNRYLDTSRRKADLQRRVGANHSAVASLDQQMVAINRLLFEELQRILETYKNELDVAEARERALAESLERQRATAVTANSAQAHLREFERRATTYSQLYQDQMQHYQNALQRESFPVIDGEIVSKANPPIEPSEPRKSLAIAAGIALGAVLGLCFGVAREVLDRTFRLPLQFRELGIPALGIVPTVRELSHSSDAPLPPMMRYAQEHPFSAFSESIRSLRAACDLSLRDKKPKLIGFISLLPNEGKSTVAKSFASLCALQGVRTLLIDADTRNPTLSKAIGRAPSETRRALNSSPALRRRLFREADTGLYIQPSKYAPDDVRAADGMTEEDIRQAVCEAHEKIDYLVVDLPPFAPIVAAQALSPVVDAFILVVEWGVTSRGAVRAALEKQPAIREKLLGAVLNKVDTEKYALYQHFETDDYYYHTYERYYHGPSRRPDEQSPEPFYGAE